MRVTTRGPQAHVRGVLAAAGLLVGATLLAVLALAASPARAASIEVSAFGERTEDPRSLTFTARAQAPAGLTEARFTYKVLNPDGNVGGGGAVSVSPGSEVDLTFTLETVSNDRYIPVGSTFVYQWQLTDGEGDSVLTEEREYLFLDGRYQWESRTEGASPPVTVFWYGNNEDRAERALEATRGALADVSGLLETQVPYPIKVMVWGSEPEGALARRPRGRTFDATVTTGGQRVSPDLIFVFVPAADIVRHEVGHIVTHVAGDGPFTSLPSWIDEGTAVWAQSSAGGGYLGAVGLALQGNRTLNLRSMQSPSNRPEEVNLFYGQSYSTVDYLIGEYGQQRFAELFRVHRAGDRIDDALTEVYGFDQNGLYNEWRVANGLEPVVFATAAPGSASAPTEATRAPLGIPTPRAAGATATEAPAAATPASGAATPEAVGEAADGTSSGGRPVSAIAVALVAVLLAAALGLGGMLLLRRSDASA